jgi:hypothetical protein
MSAKRWRASVSPRVVREQQAEAARLDDAIAANLRGLGYSA